MVWILNCATHFLQRGFRIEIRLLQASVIFLLAIVGAVSTQAVAQTDKPAAESAAMVYLKAFDSDDLAEVYQGQLGPTFKQATRQEQFVQQGGMLRIQWGGPAEARVLVGSQLFSQLPNGQTGQFYYVRFKTKYPNGAIFQDVYLEKSDNNWKVGGFWIFGVPPGG